MTDIINRLDRIVLGADVRGLDATEVRAMQDAKTEIIHLREIVERLPKTADGVPVCPGDFGLWGVNADCEIVEHCTAPGYLMCEGGEYEAWHIEERGGELYDVIIPAHEAFSDGAYYGAVSACYSTREAAEAARQGGGE